ncbi:MAG: hypothetical protein J0H74_36865 [Chitinophagaceae bacterium]|nr:hypothetical protein [Chitinophagaceae bacterium]
MLFFDYLHYFIFKFYSGYREKGALSSSAGIIGGFQTINVLTGVILFMLATKQKVFLETWLVISSLILFQVTTYIRYIYKENHSIAAIEKAWLNKTEANRNMTRNLLVVYGVVSVLGFLGLALYLGIRR